MSDDNPIKSVWKPRWTRFTLIYFLALATLIGILLWWSAHFTLTKIWAFFAPFGALAVLFYVTAVQDNVNARDEWNRGLRTCSTCNGSGKVKVE